MRPQLGEYGAWLGPGLAGDARVNYAVEAEELGYGTIWLGIGREPVPDLSLAERVLEATSTVTVATAIVNMWVNDPIEIATSYRRIARGYGDRFLLGVGIGHPESIQNYRKPYDTMIEYLDVLDREGIPRDNRILGALGPRALRLAAIRAAGSHPYLTTPCHTRQARELLGSHPLLAPEQKVVVSEDPIAAREIGRPFVQHPYLGLSNYVNNLLRAGYTHDDVAAGGSDRLIDDLVAHGTPDMIATALREHRAAGADHVGIQVLTQANDSPMPGFQAMATALAP